MNKGTEQKESNGRKVVYFGIDFHKEVTEIAMISSESGEVLGRTRIKTQFNKILAFMKKEAPVGSEIVCCYEASCCGYGLYRYLNAQGVKCHVIAPHSVEKSRENRKKKNDRLDAVQLGRQLRSGALKIVRAPSEEHERIRRYIRMSWDLEKDCRRLKTKISMMLLGMGIQSPDNAGKKWSDKYWQWLRRLEMDRLSQEVLMEYLTHLEYLEGRLAEIIVNVKHLIVAGKGVEVVGRLISLKGIDILSAATLWAEVYDFERFGTARAFMGYMGLDCYEHSSGEIEHRGHITKLGNVHCRRVLVTASMAYKSIPRVGATLQKRQGGEPVEVIAKSWAAQQRLHKRYWYLFNKKGCAGKAKVAVARELAGFVWGIMKVGGRGDIVQITDSLENRALQEARRYRHRMAA